MADMWWAIPIGIGVLLTGVAFLPKIRWERKSVGQVAEAYATVRGRITSPEDAKYFDEHIASTAFVEGSK